MSEILKEEKKVILPCAAPVAVIVAGAAVVLIKCLNILLLLNMLGPEGVREFINTSAQGWDTTFILLAGLVLFCCQIQCGVMIIQGGNIGRWGFVFCQCIVISYLLLAKIGDVFPEIFTVEGENCSQTLKALMIGKLPDAIIIALLFGLRESRDYFALSSTR